MFLLYFLCHFSLSLCSDCEQNVLFSSQTPEKKGQPKVVLQGKGKGVVSTIRFFLNI